MELKFGLTAPASCSYLPSQQEQVVFLLPETPVNASLYQQLLQHNFRRSGNDLYRPRCPACQQCQSVRLNAANFQPNKQQRRILNKAKAAGLTAQLVQPDSEAYYPLYQSYIDSRHTDGSMYPACPEQLRSLLRCDWLSVRALEIYHQQRLIAVAVVDELDNAFSAVYTFYHPDYQRFSPGKLAILWLTELSRQAGKEFLYLGYYVADCRKMAYKADFLPQQRFSAEKWLSFG